MSGMTPERLAEIRGRCERAENFGVSFAISNVHATYSDRADLLDEVDRLRAGIEDAANELVREMTANVPLSPPNREFDPNDEFKRCAVDRMERAKRWRTDIITPLLNPIEQAGGAS